MPFIPLPDTDWYDASTMPRRPMARWSGPTAMTAVIAVQLGFAMIPGCPRRAWAFTSGTTSGTSGAIRHALELSTHTTPAAAASRQIVRDTVTPADSRARSQPRSASSDSSRIVSSSPRNATRDPADRALASGTSSSTGNERCSRVRVISRPTAPVAPITATRISAVLPLHSLGAQVELRVHGPDGAVGVGRADHARHPDRRGRDHLDVDALVRQRGEHVGRDSRV